MCDSMFIQVAILPTDADRLGLELMRPLVAAFDRRLPLKVSLWQTVKTGADQGRPGTVVLEPCGPSCVLEAVRRSGPRRKRRRSAAGMAPAGDQSEADDDDDLEDEDRDDVDPLLALLDDGRDRSENEIEQYGVDQEGHKACISTNVVFSSFIN
jgi:hypothetical protein